MIGWSQAALSAFAAGTVAKRHWLLWVQPKNRETGQRVDVGIWDGSYEATSIMVDGAARTYRGAEGIIEVPEITYSLGTDVRTLDVTLGVFDNSVRDIIRQYDARFAPVELHAAIYDAGMQLIGVRRFFKGELDKAPVQTEPAGGGVKVTLSMVSSARKGARHLALKKSDASHRLRGGDRFRRYGDLGTVADAKWGG